MTKILFLNLPYKFNISRASRWPEKTKSGTLYYPYWLAYGLGVCQKEGFDCKLIDCITKQYTIDETIQEVKKYNPDYIMTETTTATCDYDYNTLNQIKKENPNTKIIIGGTHPTILPEQVLEKCPAIDYVARQEYDYTIPDIIKNNENPEQVLGITYRENGEIKHTDNTPNF